MRKGREIVPEKADIMNDLFEREFADLLSITESNLAKLWGRKEENVWNQYLKVASRKKK